jgi:hypothetical protein
MLQQYSKINEFLAFNNRRIDLDSIEGSKIEAGTTIHMVLSLRGGM